MMIISIASGKGGTGKTTVATNLAVSLESDVQILDCDVEEPNSHLFIKPTIEEVKTITTPVPEVDMDKYAPYAENAGKYASSRPLSCSVRRSCRFMNSVTVAAGAWKFALKRPSRKQAAN